VAVDPVFPFVGGYEGIAFFYTLMVGEANLFQITRDAVLMGLMYSSTWASSVYTS